MMQTIVQNGRKDIAVQEREIPEPAEDEVLVKVHSAGLCGSDAHAYLYEDGYEWIPLPRIMGHEYSGTVTKVGSEISEFREGDKIVEEPIHHCGECFQCRNNQQNVCQNFSITGMHDDGAYAEFVTVKERHLHPVPESVPLDHAAVTEPLSIATRAVLDQSVTAPGDTVLVEGPGPIGVFTALVADGLGAEVLVSGLGQDEKYRLPLLEEVGIETINVEANDLKSRTEELTDGIGFDVVFDATGHKSGVEMAADKVRKGGQILVVGLPGDETELFLTPLVRGEIDLNTSYGSLWRNFEQALRLLKQDEIPVAAILDDTYDISNPEDAFESFLASETCKPVFQFGR